jgi:hypothetical protein
MLLELVGTVMAGLAAGMFVFALRAWKPHLVPKWLLPIAAGAAMIVATVSSEYGWYGRVSSQLPETFVVAQTVEDRAPWRPWTYLAPFVSRFVAVDRGTTKTHPAVPDQRIVELHFFGRWTPYRRVPVLWDCAGNRTAALAEGAAFGADGQVTGIEWQPIAPDDPIFVAACGEA